MFRNAQESVAGCQQGKKDSRSKPSTPPSHPSAPPPIPAANSPSAVFQQSGTKSTLPEPCAEAPHHRFALRNGGAVWRSSSESKQAANEDKRGNSSSGFGNPRSTAQCNEHKHRLHSCLMPFCAGSNNRPVEWVPVWLSRFETFDAGPTTCSRPSQASIHTAKAQHASTPHAGCRSLALSACFARGVRHHQSRCLSAVRPAPSPARLCPHAVRGCLTFPLEDFS